MIQTYDEAVSYVRDFIPFTLYNTDAYKKTETHDPLDRMRCFLKFLRTPEQGFRSILIGGTSGKGSTSYLISHMLTTAGYKTGLTLSPHLVRINERIQINGKEIPDEDFIQLVNAVAPAVEKMKDTEYGVPSYFEITIGMAFLYFKQQNVDIAVVEIGMGGTYDATNVLQPLVSVLTNVSLDHTQFLGETVEEIAKTKVGIIKNYELRIKNQELRPVVISGVTQLSVIEIVEKQCEEVGVQLFRLGKDFPLVSLRGEKRRSPVITGRSNLSDDKSRDRHVSTESKLAMTDIELGIGGEYQKENASLAIETIKQLKSFGFSVSDKVIYKALSTASFAGRFEIISYTLNAKPYTLVLDGAHNAAKMHAFVTSLQKAYPDKKYIFVISFKKDKHIEEMVHEIVRIADMIIITEFQIGTDTMISHAAMGSGDIERMIRAYGYTGDIFVENDSINAVKKAMNLVYHSVLDMESTIHDKKIPHFIRQAQDSKYSEGLEGDDQEYIIAITGSLYLVGELKQGMFKEGQ